MKPALLFFFIISNFQVNAQLDSCSVFLKGKYLEVGINDNGAFGSGQSAPAGYHPKGSASVYNLCYSICPPANSCLGFVADPDKDGWTVGSPYPYYGDYMMPGSPQEGWTIRVDGTESNNWNQNGCSPGIVGSGISGHNLSYSTSLKQVIGVWQGTYKTVTITQQSYIDTDKLHLTVFTSIRNGAFDTAKGVYYMRTIDPDNAQPESGSYNTENKIEYQLPNNKNRTLVSARGLNGSGVPIPAAYLGLGTWDCRARCFRIVSGLAPSKTTDVLYAESDTVNQKYNGTAIADAGMGLVFNLGDIPPGDSVAFFYNYIFSPAEIDSVLFAVPSSWTAYTSGSLHRSGDTLKVCGSSTIPLTMDNPILSAWTWSSPTGNYVSPTSAYTANVYVGTTTAVFLAISTASPCRTPDTVKIILQPTGSFSPTIAINGPLLKAVGMPVNIYATVTNAGSSYTLDWRKNSDLILSTTIGTSIVYIKAHGNDTITATVLPPNPACFDSAVSNTLIVFDPLYVSQINNSANAIQVYPNPIKDEMTVTGVSSLDQITLFDMMGRKIETWTITKDGNNSFNTSILPTGLYILRVLDKNGTVKAKLPIQKL